MAKVQVLGLGARDTLVRPCVDCGLMTGRFCDYCRAADRLPDETWAHNQLTPLCHYCDNKHDECHYCRRQIWCTPPPHELGEHWREKEEAKVVKEGAETAEKKEEAKVVKEGAEVTAEKKEEAKPKADPGVHVAGPGGHVNGAGLGMADLGGHVAADGDIGGGWWTPERLELWRFGGRDPEMARASRKQAELDRAARRAQLEADQARRDRALETLREQLREQRRESKQSINRRNNTLNQFWEQRRQRRSRRSR